MIRDKESKALIETDTDALQRYRIEKKKLQEVEQIKKDINIMKDQMKNVITIIDKIMEEKF
jgi:hypothetical protein